MKEWSNLAKVVYKRTYARSDNGKLEDWKDTVERVIAGNTRDHKVSQEELDRLRYFLLNRKAMPAGRGLWFSGAPAHEKLGGVALNNCWALTAESWHHFVIAQDLLMLGGGVGMSVEHKYTSKLPKVKKSVKITHKPTKDADFIIPDSREGWNEMTHRLLESFFVTGKSFTYSTYCIRGHGESIKGFGGKASGPQPFIKFVENVCLILQAREGKHVRPIDAADILCSIGEFVVAGNVRRSALIILGDAWDKEYLKAKRWDLGLIPTYRAMANYSVVCDDIEDLHPLYWKTYEAGEAFGLINRKTIQSYGRIPEKMKDTAYLVNPCAEATLENAEPCNLQEIFLPNLNSVEEFKEAGKLMHRWGKRVTMERYHHEESQEVVNRNRRIGTGITGCLQSPELFKGDVLDEVYATIQKENESYSNKLNINKSIKTTVVKPSGTLSLLGDCTPGIHPSYSKHYIRRVRFASSDPLLRVLEDAGHPMEPVRKFDNSLDMGTMVVDFFCETPEGTPTADSGFGTWKQLDTLLFTQKHWADQAVSVTVYYKREEIDQIKEWLSINLKNLKTISFLCHNEHGFKQAPLESITKEQYDKSISKIKPLVLEQVSSGDLESLECEGGVCPIK
jgi:ribonucleotide reductase alpha subunit